jgi:hypothetical protein
MGFRLPSEPARQPLIHAARVEQAFQTCTYSDNLRGRLQPLRYFARLMRNLRG